MEGLEFIFQNVARYGIFAALFAWLFFHTLKVQSERERSYQECIRENQRILQSLSENYAVLNNDIHDIKGMVGKVLRREY